MGGVSQASVPASSPPPATGGLDSACGASQLYARADHTHASSVQKAKIVTGSDGKAIWTFAKEFADLNFAVNALAQSASVISITITEVAVDHVTFNCKMARPLPNALLTLTNLLNFNIFADPAAGVTLHCFAGKNTQ